MNKLELIKALKEENGLTQFEAASVVDMFFGEMANALEKVKGLKSVDYVPFMLRNTRHIAGGIQKPVIRLK